MCPKRITRQQKREHQRKMDSLNGKRRSWFLRPLPLVSAGVLVLAGLAYFGAKEGGKQERRYSNLPKASERIGSEGRAQEARFNSESRNVIQRLMDSEFRAGLHSREQAEFSKRMHGDFISAAVGAMGRKRFSKPKNRLETIKIASYAGNLAWNGAVYDTTRTFVGIYTEARDGKPRIDCDMHELHVSEMVGEFGVETWIAAYPGHTLLGIRCPEGDAIYMETTLDSSTGKPGTYLFYNSFEEAKEGRESHPSWEEPIVEESRWNLLRIGGFLLVQGKFVEAAEVYRKEVALRDYDFEAWAYLAVCLGWIGELQQAEECMRKSLEIEPAADANWWRLGYILFNSGKFAQAKDALDRSLRLSPSGSSYRLRGEVKERLGDLGGAEEDFRKAEELGFPRESLKFPGE